MPPFLARVLISAVGACLLSTNARATSIPVGPISFSSNADYDSNFKEAPSYNGIVRNASGYLQLLGSPDGLAIFDTSATGGINGQGGSGGADANSDLTDMTISADVASSVAGGIGAGFFFRLNSAEAGGYLASVHTFGTGSVVFDVYEGASLANPGVRVFSVMVPLTGLTIAADTFYNFKVSLSGGFFLLNFASGAATATFTDTTVSTTVGQVGIVLDTISPTAATRLTNFEILPAVVTIDFETLAQVGIGFRSDSYIYDEKGFVFTDSRGINGLANYQAGNPYYLGSTMLFNNTEGDTSLSRQDGGTFDFVGIDLGKLKNPESGPITFSGYRGSDLVVTETFNFDGNVGVQRFVPHNDFSCLTEIRWPQQFPHHQFDNVLVRPRSGPGPGPQARMSNNVSSWQIDFSYLIPGTSYVVQNSSNLSDWQDGYSFTTYSPTSTYGAPAFPGVAKSFYRLRQAP